MLNEKEVLMSMLSLDLTDSAPVFSVFSKLPGAITHLDGDKNNFVYIPGEREDSVVLVAHADTVWDSFYLKLGYLTDKYSDNGIKKEHLPVWNDGIIRQGGWDSYGLGSDDRAGCAMLYLLQNSGHSLLVTDGEEHGQIGAYYLMDNYPEIADELNAHQYFIQLDRRGNSDYKTYRLNVSTEYCQYIEEETGFIDAGRNSRTDIVALCRRICGVNLSIGYYNEHTPDEYLDFDEWLYTLDLVREMLKKPQPEFLLQN